MEEYSLEFDEKWDEYFSKLDKEMQRRAWQKIQQLKRPLSSRHLKQGLRLFVAELGQYRIAYAVFEDRKVKKFYFVGTHKEYERWTGI